MAIRNPKNRPTRSTATEADRRSRPTDWKTLRELGSDAPDTILVWLEVERPPINVIAIVEHFKLDVFRADLGGWASLLEFRNNRPVVFLAQELDDRQLRLAIAAQIGNIALGSNTNSKFCMKYDRQSRSLPEFEFAANLLVPLWLLNEYTSKYGADPTPYARVFEVPTALAMTRLLDLFHIRA